MKQQWELHDLSAHLRFCSLQGVPKLSNLCPEPANACFLPGNFTFSCCALLFFLAEAPCQSILGKLEGAQLVPVVFFIFLPPAGCSDT